ncbi:hypothetical protein [Cryptosporangium sp. NPDC051539]|uniref:hypothetical protein n=1 Tax=Cryptosporangium sp. NPDC051539 TaxID=3363962 RepID=UPI0037ABC5D6
MDYALLVALGIAVVGIGLITVSSAGRDRRELRIARQIAVVERKLDALIDHLGLEVPDPEYPEVEAKLDRGEKVAAIKAYREQTGAGLKEAVDEVERLDRDRKATADDPAAPAATPAAPAATTAPATAVEPVPATTAAPEKAVADEPAAVPAGSSDGDPTPEKL